MRYSEKLFTVMLLFSAAVLFFCVVHESYESTVSVAVNCDDELTVTLPEGLSAEKNELFPSEDTLALYNVSGSLIGSDGKSFAVGGYFRKALSAMPLRDYLDAAEKTRSASIYGFSSEECDGGGFIWRYSVKKEDGNDIRVLAFFAEGQSSFYTLQLSAAFNAQKKDGSEAIRNEALEAAFNSIIHSVTFSEHLQKSGKRLEEYSFRKTASLPCTQLFREERADDKTVRFVRVAKAL